MAIDIISVDTDGNHGVRGSHREVLDFTSQFVFMPGGDPAGDWKWSFQYRSNSSHNMVVPAEAGTISLQPISSPTLYTSTPEMLR